MRRLLYIFSVVIIVTLISSCGSDSNSTGPDSSPDTDPDPEATTGTVEITTSTSGDDQDDDGYEVLIDGTTETIGPSETVTVSGLEEGSYDVELTNIAENCESDGKNPRTVSVTAGDTVSLVFEVKCQAVMKNKIAFISDRNGRQEIFLMNTDGSNPKRIKNDQFEGSYYPTIASDGTKIAYVGNNSNDVGSEIYVMDADGSNITQVTDGALNPSYPTWSADDSKIAFAAERNDNDDIYVINTDGTNEDRLTNDEGSDGYPSWSPDGDKIVFQSNRSGTFSIYTMNIDGTGLKKITDGRQPSWSPDGSKIVFQDYPPNGNEPEIYTINSDGTGLQRITNNSVYDSFPAWSADGSELVFVSGLSGNLDIYKINADGTGSLINLTNNQSEDILPFWSPVQ